MYKQDICKFTSVFVTVVSRIRTTKWGRSQLVFKTNRCSPQSHRWGWPNMRAITHKCINRDVESDKMSQISTIIGKVNTGIPYPYSLTLKDILHRSTWEYKWLQGNLGAIHLHTHISIMKAETKELSKLLHYIVTLTRHDIAKQLCFTQTTGFAAVIVNIIK